MPCSAHSVLDLRRTWSVVWAMCMMLALCTGPDVHDVHLVRHVADKQNKGGRAPGQGDGGGGARRAVHELT